MPYTFLRSRASTDRGPVDNGGNSVTQSINPGDMLYSTGSGVRQLASSTNAASFVGVSTVQYPSQFAPAGSGNVVTFCREGIVLMSLNAGDVVTPGVALYVAGPQTVTVTVAGSSIGRAAFDQAGVPAGFVAVSISPAL